MSRLIRTFAALALLGGLGLAGGCSSEPEAGRTSAVRGPSQEAARSPFWVDPRSPAARQAGQWRQEGRGEDAKALRRIADQPVAIWPAGEEPAAMMRAATSGADRKSRTALFVAYDIPHRDCGQHSAGGARDAEAYRQWIDRFSTALGDTRAWVILEPDAVAHIVDGCTPREYHEERYGLLSEAIDRIKRQPNTKVYLDAGNPAWITDPWQLREPLARAGLARADGFALNVSNFQTNETAEEYGRRLSQYVGDKHFVIDTSRNGNGPLGGDRGQAWCNPPGRALGTPPTTETGDPLVDAFLWIKRPGESDGPCRGGPAAGKWWADYALGLARGART